MEDLCRDTERAINRVAVQQRRLAPRRGVMSVIENNGVVSRKGDATRGRRDYNLASFVIVKRRVPYAYTTRTLLTSPNYLLPLHSQTASYSAQKSNLFTEKIVVCINLHLDVQMNCQSRRLSIRLKKNISIKIICKLFIHAPLFAFNNLGTIF